MIPTHLSVRTLIMINFFLFQEADHLMVHSNSILTAIVHGMRKEEQNLHVKLAATNAMLETLEFSKDNFDQEVKKKLTAVIL